MKDQAQQPPNPNGTTRGPGNAIGSTGVPGGKDQAQQPPPATASNPSLYNFGGLGPQVAANPNDSAQSSGASFQQQGFAGVGGQPAASSASSAPPTLGNQPAPSTLPGTMWAGNQDPKINVPGEPSQTPPQLPSGDALGSAMKDAQSAAYKTATGYLDPQFANSQHDLEAKLANQGIPQNSEAWNRAMDEFNRGKTFAYGQAENNAVQQGNAAHGQLFSEGMQGAQFSNTVRQQLVNEGFTKEQIDNLEQQHRFDNSMTMRNQDINELLLQQQNPLQMYQALNGNGQVTPPNFTNTPGTNVGGTDIMQAIQQAYGGQLNSYNAATGNANSNNAAMASIIAAIICDRRLKTNVRMIGMHVVGVPLYEFDYVWGEKGIGVMADELEAVKPEAVVTLACGYKAVDYARI